MPQFCGLSNAAYGGHKPTKTQSGEKPKGDIKMGKSKIKMIRHYAENR